ncbi:periplasmic heavy metal sensor [Myxococcus sp. XM-1-1-1]|uniref:periplasmic heavy metal sensor n=1 Tax=Myxococcus sp. XM-1-1-1 TaxID=2874602 RepID=UPI001CBC105F|nr:periplasmic heavy metal sensor [Myxococcus sp. XM-1-1-1]MBZ4409570.1 periplasmic heavy metal sensor [Myxococcus sp. XM-1-1-1]
MKLRTSMLLAAAALSPLLASSPAQAQSEPENVVIHRSGPGTLHVMGPADSTLPLGPLPPAAHGIPPQVVEKLGIPRDVAKQIQDLTFDANEAVIPLEADLKRAQLQLERQLRADSTDENAVLKQVEEVGRAETAVRKNRLSLMVRIKRLLGPELWRKVEAEMGTVRIQKRIELRKGFPGEDGPSPSGPFPGGPFPRKP